MPSANRPPKSVRLTPAAANDLDEAFAYVSERNRGAAVRLLGRLRCGLQTLADHPEIGVALSPDGFELLTPGIRFLVVEPYIVFYRESGLGAIVLRVMHSRRDFLGELLE
jgi:toxin ParE1/3/4